MSESSQANADKISANEAYKRSGSKKPFAQWLKEAKESGLLQEGKDILASLFNKRTSDAVNSGDSPRPVDNTTIKTDKILGMPKYVAIGLGVIVVVGIGYGVYKMMNSKK